MDEGADFAHLDKQLCFAIYAASHAFNAAYRPLLEPHGLTYPQFIILLVLWEKGRLSLKALGDALQLDSGTLTPLTKRMEAAGLLRRVRSKVDERSVHIELTEDGDKLRPLAGQIRKAMICSLGGKVEPVLELRSRIMQITEQLRTAPHPRNG
ncbi:MarR family winged helix-turn-helix transcriptional regulator [Methylobacterium radiodurans]|uniref:MarR family transcriptional regulator n=1 Tax=Methylobacterium radiodurans TaxID=2202828 RepID=A0A2U8VNF2_9HYPH|nr:MarR family transcriptional regulator [Methylobacterium radiodurans]AWN35080.1 MarR family transcriptional regulator [Methylobacterium radiodurans]